MNYIVANKNKVIENSNIDCLSHRTSKSGEIIINEKELDCISGETKEQKLLTISGTVITHNEALEKITKEDWK